MKNKVKYLIKGLVLLFVLSSCKAYRNAENLRPKFPKELRAGEIQSSQLEKFIEEDILIIEKKDGSRDYMIFKSFQADTLVGTTRKKSQKYGEEIGNLKVALGDIDKLYVKRVSAANTIGVLVAGGAGLAIIILVIGLSTWDLGF